MSWRLIVLASVAAAALFVCRMGAATPVLAIGRIEHTGTVPAGLIVGRAHVRDRTWLLTDRLVLIDIAEPRASVAVHPIVGLAREDRPWGLAALEEGTLWTLAAARSLVRLDAEGRAHERIPVALPRVALFGAGNRVLFQQLPVGPGTSALLSAPPRRPSLVQTWPGLIQRARASRELEVAQNLVSCGIGVDGWLPCWFAEDALIAVSDGREVRRIDGVRPLHDVALAAHSTWLLVAGRDSNGGSLVGTTLLFRDDRSNARAALELKPAARLVLSATDDGCRLLTVEGSLMQVTVAP